MIPYSTRLISNFGCPRCGAEPHNTQAHGSFSTRHGGKIARFKCRNCHKTFSSATYSICYRQKRRDCNPLVYKDLTSGVSQRRCALNLKINIKTVARKFLFLGEIAAKIQPQLLSLFPLATEFEFDELETSEHSKCKPLSVHMAVHPGTRRILGFKLSKMPAKGKLSAIAFKKYGARQDLRKKDRIALFEEIKPLLISTPRIKSDENPHYRNDVRKSFPSCQHQAYKGQKSADIGQGELKKMRFDPLFSVNHTLAKLRADINRLIRKTWCTTKKEEALRLHLHLFTLRHNTKILNKINKSKLAS